MNIRDQDKSRAPQTICDSNQSNLERWLRGSRKCMPFAISRIWREPKNSTDDCYFYIINILKYQKVKGRKVLTYPNIPLSIAPVSHHKSLPALSPLHN